jgi:alkylation response protein AidB-like acyl-CoA dehydrogenase
VDFEYSDDQQLLMTSFEGMLERFREPPQGQHGYVAYSDELQAELSESGFLEIAQQPGFGLLEAAMLVEAAASCPVSVELAASAMIGPLLGLPAPVTVAWGRNKPVRFLPMAKTVCVIEGDEVSVGTPSADIMRVVNGVAAYPIAMLTAMPHDARRLSEGEAATVRRRAVIGIAAEAAGLMRGALENTVQYVKDRQQFGQPLGNFQAIQHRLAEDAQLVRCSRWLAFRAAYTDDPNEASVACLYAQEAMRKVINDCHQFSGAMGLTLEFPLHLWTYRLKVLQGEAGGKGAQARLVADQRWSQALAA